MRGPRDTPDRRMIGEPDHEAFMVDVRRWLELADRVECDAVLGPDVAELHMGLGEGRVLKLDCRTYALVGPRAQVERAE